MKRGRHSKTLKIQVSEAQFQLLSSLAAKDDLSLSSFARRALFRHLALKASPSVQGEGRPS
jgi:hypothetical protein